MPSTKTKPLRTIEEHVDESTSVAVGAGAGTQADDVRSHGKLPSSQMEPHENSFAVLLLLTRSQFEGGVLHHADGTTPVRRLVCAYL